MKIIKNYFLLFGLFFQASSLFAVNVLLDKPGFSPIGMCEEAVTVHNLCGSEILSPAIGSEVVQLRKEMMDLQKKHLQELQALKDSHKKEILSLKKIIDELKNNTANSSDDDKKLQKKLSGIKLPQLALFNAPLPEAMMEIVRQSRKFDFEEKEIGQKGVNIITKEYPSEPFPQVTITLNSMELGKALRFLTEMIGWKYEVRNGAIYVQKFTDNPAMEFLETGVYELDQKTVNKLSLLGGKGKDPLIANDPFAPRPVKKGKMNTGLALKFCFEKHGVVFDPTKGHQFVFDGFQVLIKHEKIYLDAIENIINRVKKFP
jgi:hypothetical protein